jgi:hypothetical protein
VRRLIERVPGQQVGLSTDRHPDFYSSLGFRPAKAGMKIVGTWLNCRCVRVN